MSRSRKRWLGGILVVSVALNVFLGAFFLGDVVFDHDRDKDDGRMLTMRMELKALAKALPEEAREALHSQLKNRADEMRPVFQNIHDTRDEITELLAAETLDESALRQSFNALQASLGKVHGALQEIVFEASKDMTPKQRQRMAEVLGRMHEKNGDEHEEDGEAGASDSDGRPDGEAGKKTGEDTGGR